MKHNTLRSSTTLDHNAILDLATGNIDVIHVPNFYEQGICEKIACIMEGSPLFGHYENAAEIGRVGKAFFETVTSEDSEKIYWNHAIQWVKDLRKSCAPYLTPIDKFRIELDEAWKFGSHLASLEKGKMFVGLARIFQEGSKAEPHQDVLEWDAPESILAKEVKFQLGVNIYLRTTESGGELVVWNQKLNREEYEGRKQSGSYGLVKEALTEDYISLKPSAGDLVLFDARKVHAVTSPKGGNRISWSCFAGMRNFSEPMVVWS